MIRLKDIENRNNLEKNIFSHDRVNASKTIRRVDVRYFMDSHSPANTRSKIPQLMAPSYITRILAMSEVDMHTKVQVERCLQENTQQNGFR
jgi:hypothetical protein